jgi:ribosomal protein S18 acetylase RimI-like enzyme
MTDEIILRPAVVGDAASLARLWVDTFPDKFGPILGNKAEAVLYDWLRLSSRHVQTTTVAEIDNTVAGYIVLETPSAPRVDSGRWLWRALQLHNGIFGALRGFVLMVLLDTDHQLQPNEIYIEMVGVDRAWRGRGLAAQLLQYAEATARREGVDQISLNVVSGNAPAMNLYRKSGYITQQERRNRTLKWLTGHSGYYQMVKQISPQNKKRET